MVIICYDWISCLCHDQTPGASLDPHVPPQNLACFLSVNIIVFNCSTCLYLVLMLKFRAANIAI